MKGAIEWFSKNHVAANFLMLLVLVMGIKTWFELRKEIFPETSINAIAITVPYPSAAPEEVEKGVVIPIEEEIQDIDGIEKITGSAREGAGSVVIEVKAGFDVRNIMDDVKSRIDAIDNFPEEAEEPRIQELLIKNKTLAIAVSADTDEATLRKLAEQVRDDLLLLDDVTQVTLSGVRPYEISIEVSEDTLRNYGLTLDQVAEAVRASSLDLPGGSVKTEAGEILLRTNQKRYTRSDFEGITLVAREDGTRIALGDVATVRDGFEDVDVEMGFDGKPAVLVQVFRTGDEDTLDVAEAAKKYVEEAKTRFPDGVTLEVWSDDSVFLSGRMDLLAKNAVAGLVLVFIILAVFLRPSLAALVALGIPVAFAGAVWLMPFWGISVNMISLFAFILVLGIVVDDAIVVGENVFRRMRGGEDPKVAAPEGTHEVGVVVIFGIITTMIAFTPMLGVSGVGGKIWRNIPLVVIPVLFFSLLQSKLVLPSHLAMLSPIDPHRKVGPVTRFRRRFTDGLEDFVEHRYRPALEVMLRWRYLVLTTFVAILVVTLALVGTGFVRFQFFPEVEAEIISAKLVLPNGVPFAATRDAIEKIADAGSKIGELHKDRAGNPVTKHILASAGAYAFVPDPFAKGAGAIATNVGDVTIELSKAEDRRIRSAELTSVWRELSGTIPGAVELSFQSIAAGSGNAIDLQVSGDDLDKLEAAVGEIKAALANYRGVIDIADNNLAGKRELELFIKPSAEALGLRLIDLSRQVRQGFYGEEAQRLQRGRDEVKVMVRYPKDERENLASLERMKIRLPDGSEIPFSEVATVAYGRGYATIDRADRRRAITITADIDPNVPDANANQVVAGLEEGVLREVRSKYPGVTYSFEGEQKDQRDSVAEIGIGFVLSLLGMYVLMAVPLRSYIQPAIIMTVIPFGIVGAIIGHIIMFTELSIMSMCGIVALAGVVVNDSLVLVDYVNRERALGHPVIQAVREAGARRFRPILLTSLTTFGGLLPMLVETDLQAKFLVPMAISLGFGILFATTITLILVPAIYLILEDVKGIFLRQVPAAAPPPPQAAPL
ncbi:efflux RND transporter permease subunit [soil metagenome]